MFPYLQLFTLYALLPSTGIPSSKILRLPHTQFIFLFNYHLKREIDKRKWTSIYIHKSLIDIFKVSYQFHSIDYILLLSFFFYSSGYLWCVKVRSGDSVLSIKHIDEFIEAQWIQYLLVRTRENATNWIITQRMFNQTWIITMKYCIKKEKKRYTLMWYIDI